MSLPSAVWRLLRRVVPPEFRDDLIDDLEEGFARRRRAGERAWSWLGSELVRTPWFGLWSQARRMRVAGTRREMPAPGGGGGMGGFGTGIRLAVRSLLRRPSYTVVTVLTLVLSIGSATLIFSVLEGVLLRPLPYEGGERIYRLYGTNQVWREAEQEVLRGNWDQVDVTQELLRTLGASIGGIEAVGGLHPFTARFDDGGEPERLPGAYVVDGLFETLSLAPLVGRLPTAEEIREGAPVLVLSESLWNRRFGRSDEVLGRSVSVNGTPHSVVGVLPGAFAFPTELTRWWAPLPPDFAGGREDFAAFRGVVRIRTDVEPTTVSEGIEAVVESMATSNPAYASMGARLAPLDEVVVGEVSDGLRLLFLAVALVVLIASVNLANLVVARGARRRGELAMRAALGAGRGALVWDVLAETVVVSAVGGIVGVLLATQLLDPFIGLLERANPGFPRTDNVGINPLVLAFSAGVAILTALLSGLVPALNASRRAPWEALQQGRRSRGGVATRRTQSVLLLTEAVLAMVLLAGAGLLLRSAAHVASIDPGYDGASVAYLTVEVPEDRYPTPADAEAMGRELEARLARLPGTASVARTSSLPGLGGASGALVWGEGDSMAEATLRWSTSVSPGYFEAMGIPLLQGRGFRDDDDVGSQAVAVVSELFATRYFPNRDPVGATFQVGTGTRMEGGSVVADGGEPVRVVGVAADVRQLVVVMEPDAMFYRPMAQDGGEPHFVLRIGGAAEGVISAARAEVLAYDPALLVEASDVLDRAARRLMAPLEVRMILILALAVLAAVLIVAGIYGVVAYVVSDRTHEIGVRIALGARAGGESVRVVAQALLPIAVGAVGGLVAAYFAAALLEGALFGVEALDVPTYLAAFGTMLGVAALAAWIPARRAAAVDPVRVLTEE